MIDVVFDGQHISNAEITFPRPARTDNQTIYMGSPHLNAADVLLKDFKFQNLGVGKFSYLIVYTKEFDEERIMFAKMGHKNIGCKRCFCYTVMQKKK